MNRTTGEWHVIPGNADAKAFIAQYPTPKHLRWAIGMDGWGIITPAIRALPWSPEETIGQVMRDPAGFSSFDLRHLHLMVTEEAQDRRQRVAPDGTITYTAINTGRPAPNRRKRNVDPLPS